MTEVTVLETGIFSYVIMNQVDVLPLGLKLLPATATDVLAVLAIQAAKPATKVSYQPLRPSLMDLRTNRRSVKFFIWAEHVWFNSLIVVASAFDV